MTACTCPQEMYVGYNVPEHLEGCPYGEWENQNKLQHLISPNELANKIHRSFRRGGEEHSSFDSCGCLHLARYYLECDEKLRLFWPDKDGNNQWGDANE